jgi:hypothetical protein
MLPGDFTVSEGHRHPLVRLMHTASLYTVFTSMHQCHQLQPCRHFLPQKTPHTSLHPPETKTGTFLPVYIPWDTNILGSHFIYSLDDAI